MIGNGDHMIVQDSASKPGAWILTNQSVKPDGQPFTGPPTHACLSQGIQACNASIARLHLRQVITLPAGQPVLGLPVVRDGDLPGARGRPGRFLRLVDQAPAAHVTTPYFFAAEERR